MNWIVSGALWLFAPGLQMWREQESSSAARRLGMRTAIRHSLARALLFAFFLWALWSGNWYAAAVIAGTLLVLALLTRSLMRRLIKR